MYPDICTYLHVYSVILSGLETTTVQCPLFQRIIYSLTVFYNNVKSKYAARITHNGGINNV